MKVVLLISAALASALASASTLLVSNYFGDSVSRFDLGTGSFLGSFGTGQLDGPQSIRVSGSAIFVASELSNSIQKFDINGNSLGSFYSGSALDHPTSIAIMGNGDVLASNFNGDSVAKFSSAGVFQSNLVSPGSGGLNGPDVGLITGPDGNIWVASFFTNSILRYNPTTGAFLGQVVTSGLGGLVGPREMLIHGNKLYVSSETGSKVLRYNLDGTFSDSFVAAGAGGLSGAVGMVFDDSGNLLVASANNNRILRYNGTTGAFIDVFLSTNINGPTALTVVPEPTSILVATVGSAWLLRRRKR